MANERRTFSRIHFEAETTVQQNRTLWLVNLLDISLKGLLIDKPKDWDGDANTPFHAAIHLNDSSHITMKIQQRHETDEHIGFECLHIDIDSIAHLRRLVELNIGDLALLEREVSALIDHIHYSIDHNINPRDTMKAIGYSECLPIQDPLSLQDIELPQPVATGSDLLIKVKAIAVNPVDSKIRHRVAAEQGQYKVIGWDGVGEVVSLGDKASLFKLGDQVFYAGDLNRQGCNAEYQLVDERLVGHKPQNLTTADAAALPLTSITAWEMLFDHLTIKQQAPEHIVKTNEILLIVGAAGGVGSILIQIAKAITGATVIATAARESSQSWVKKLGADYVIDHNKPLASQIKALGIGPVTHIASLNNTDAYFEAYTELLPPFGKIAMIDDPEAPLDVMKLKPKSLSLHIEFMFARAMFNASDIAEQGRLLNRVAELVDLGYLQTTTGKNLGLINADNLKAAHKAIESRSAIGKIVLQGF